MDYIIGQRRCARGAGRNRRRNHQCGGCNLLFIGASEKKRWPAVLESLKTDSVLTVGETVNFAAAGGIINFKRDAGKVSFEINVYAAQRARLKISSKLLSLAKIIKDDKP